MRQAFPFRPGSAVLKWLPVGARLRKKFRRLPAILAALREMGFGVQMNRLLPQRRRMRGEPQLSKRFTM